MLDLRTVIFMASISCLLISLVLAGAYRVYPKTIRGLDLWAIGSLLHGTAGIVLGFRGEAPDWLTVVVANSVFVFAYGLYWKGLRQLLGLDTFKNWIYWIAFVAAVAAYLVFFTYWVPDIRLRIVLISSISCVFFGTSAWTIWRTSTEKTGFDLFYVAVAVFGALCTLARVVSAATAPPGTQDMLFAPTSFQMIYIVTYNLLALVSGISFFLLATSKLQIQLTDLARKDPLTGALNRRAMMEHLVIEVAASQRKQRTSTMLLMDLDKFKNINDKFGHEVGDRVLVHFVELISHSKRAQDFVVRLGGEEFAVILPDTLLDGAVHLAQRIHAALNNRQGDKDLPHYTASIGISVWEGNTEGEGSVDAWFKHADEAVYRAKSAGRNCIEIGH